MSTIRLDILIVNYNTAHLLPRMFDALQSAIRGFDVRFLVIDNASSDDSARLLAEEYPGIVFVRNETNVGFGRANNQLLPLVSAEYVLLLNTDSFVAPDTISKTISYMQESRDCGVLGVRLCGTNNDQQPCCRYFPTPLNVFLLRTGFDRFLPWVRLVDDHRLDHTAVQECDWVPGCYYLIRREVLDEIGLFDPRYFLYYEEVDHCRRVKAAGWKVVFYPHTSVVHIGGESAKSAGEITSSGRQVSVLQVESELLYFRKHHGCIGLFLHIFLVALGDFILTSKAVVRRKGIHEMRSYWRHFRLTWRLLIETRIGAQATR